MIATTTTSSIGTDLSTFTGLYTIGIIAKTYTTTTLIILKTSQAPQLHHTTTPSPHHTHHHTTTPPNHHHHHTTTITPLHHHSPPPPSNSPQAHRRLSTKLLTHSPHGLYLFSKYLHRSIFSHLAILIISAFSNIFYSSCRLSSFLAFMISW